METTLTLRPSEIGLDLDYGKAGKQIHKRLIDTPAILWCKQEGMDVYIGVLGQEVVTRYKLNNKYFELEHEENFIQLHFHCEEDALLFKLTWL